MFDWGAILRHINHWLDADIRDPNPNFPGICFPKPHEGFQKTILDILWSFNFESIARLESSGMGPYQTLRWSLKLLILDHLMRHDLVIPKERVEELLGQLKTPYQVRLGAEGQISPRLVNRIVKHMFLPMLQKAMERVLGGLHNLLRSTKRKADTWEAAFSVVCICLMVVGRNQEALIERATVQKSEENSGLDLNTATVASQEMEDELVTHLIGMFHHRFGTGKKRNGHGSSFNPLALDPSERPPFESKFAELIRTMMDIHG
jgi:hypothetical protein